MQISLDRIMALRNRLGGVEVDELNSIPRWLKLYAGHLGEALAAETDVPDDLTEAIYCVIAGLRDQAALVSELTERLQRLTL
jgi:hypothetical protein